MSERRDRSGTDLVSSAANEPSLKQALDAVAVPGLLIGHRVISLGDEGALRGAEATSISSSIANVRRASGAARMVARSLLAQLGYPEAQVPMGAGGAPVWPVGVVGSLAHDDEIAVAAVGLRRDLASVGIDVEWAGALPSDMLALVATQCERRRIEDDLVKAKLLFAVKEAVYKAVYPLDRVFLEFGDIEVDLAGGTAMTRAGRTLTLRSCISSHIVALALVHP
jgi:4'-phosphopantetheinyl transferase EntD